MILLGKYPSINFNTEYSAFLKFDYNKVLVDKVKSLPTRKYVADQKVWEVPIASLNRIVKLFGVDNIQKFTDFPEYDTYIEYHKKHVQGKMTIEEQKAYYRTLKMEVEFKTKTAPKGHQVEMFNKALHTDSILLTDVMGLGKTAQSLYVADYKKSIGQVNGVLIICGVNSLKYNWVDEIEKHSFNSCQVIEGPKKKRLDKLEHFNDYLFNIINVEMLRQEEYVQAFEQLIAENKLQLIIADEVHKMTNHTCSQGANLLRLNPPYKLGLTGTPITKHIEKFWSILSWMNIINDNYWNFRKRYCILGGYTGNEVTGHQNLDELNETLDRYQVRRTKEILDLPPKIYQTYYVTMTKDQASEYEVIKRGIIRDMESGDLKTVSPIVATGKLRQFTEQIKLDAIKELVEELHENDNSCVIFSPFKKELYTLKDEVLDKYKPYLITGDEKDSEKRQFYVNEFQSNPRPQVMMGTIATLGTGYTLTKSNYVIFLSKDWIVGNNQQAEDRCHRIGSTDTVTIISVIVKGTIDERVEEILENDQFYIDQVVDGKFPFKDNQAVWHKIFD